jgi:hypothetical protein
MPSFKIGLGGSSFLSPQTKIYRLMRDGTIGGRRWVVSLLHWKNSFIEGEATSRSRKLINKKAWGDNGMMRQKSAKEFAKIRERILERRKSGYSAEDSACGRSCKFCPAHPPADDKTKKLIKSVEITVLTAFAWTALDDEFRCVLNKWWRKNVCANAGLQDWVRGVSFLSPQTKIYRLMRDGTIVGWRWVVSIILTGSGT